MKPVQFVVLALVVLAAAAPAGAETRTARVERIRKEAPITFTGRYSIPAPMRTVSAAMHRPDVMGPLWRAFMFGPGYEVASLPEPGAVHVVDPTGIVGDLWRVSAQAQRVVYLGEGQFRHWAVPVMNKGSAVFDFTLAPRGGVTDVTVRVSLKPESQVASAALWAMAPVAQARVKSRVGNNMRDVAAILSAVARSPDAVARKLRGPARVTFEQLFPARSGGGS